MLTYTLLIRGTLILDSQVSRLAMLLLLWSVFGDCVRVYL